MNITGISFGWNCHPAGYGISNGLRATKSNGYQTCPFDEMVTNLPGVLKCIEDDFKYFMDSDYLKIIEAPFTTGGIVQGERLVHNIKYNFFFNHESPGHAGLYLSQNWQGGINHYIDNNFALLKERYNRRVNNFRNYINSGDKIAFIVARYSTDFTQFHEVISKTYPTLQYNIHHITPPESNQVVAQHYTLMQIPDNIIKLEIE